MTLIESPDNTAPIILALGTLVASLASAWVGIRAAKKTESVAVDTAKIAVKTDEMEKQGNSRWSEQQLKLDSALKELGEQKALVQRFLDKEEAEDQLAIKKRSHHKQE